MRAKGRLGRQAEAHAAMKKLLGEALSRLGSLESAD